MAMRPKKRTPASWACPALAGVAAAFGLAPLRRVFSYRARSKWPGASLFRCALSERERAGLGSDTLVG